jgi:hypothetical protein
LEKDKIIMGNWRSKEELIKDMKEHGVRVKCYPVSRGIKRGGGVGPALRISFVYVKRRETFIHGKETKKHAIELLGLRTKEDCERVNRELES